MKNIFWGVICENTVYYFDLFVLHFLNIVFLCSHLALFYFSSQKKNPVVLFSGFSKIHENIGNSGNFTTIPSFLKYWAQFFLNVMYCLEMNLQR